MKPFQILVLALLFTHPHISLLHAMSTDAQELDQRLSKCDDFQIDWLKVQLTPEAMVAESDRTWRRYVDLFKSTLERHGLGERKDLVSSKEQMFEYWARQRAVLLGYLASNEGSKLYRYDGGEGEHCGYVVMKEGKPMRMLMFRVNRPDPNIGNADFPFPQADK